MRFVIPLFLSAVLTASCSGGTTTQPDPTPPIADAATPPVTPTAAPDAAPVDNPQPPDPPVARPVSDDECETLLDHVVRVARAAHATTVDPDVTPTDEQIAKIRARMATDFLPWCRGLDRATYRCAIAAETRDELARCQP